VGVIPLSRGTCLINENSRIRDCPGERTSATDWGVVWRHTSRTICWLDFNQHVHTHTHSTQCMCVMFAKESTSSASFLDALVVKQFLFIYNLAKLTIMLYLYLSWASELLCVLHQMYICSKWMSLYFLCDTCRHSQANVSILPVVYAKCMKAKCCENLKMNKTSIDSRLWLASMLRRFDDSTQVMASQR